MPKSESLIFIWRRSMARMVSFSTGISYCLPLRLSVMVSVSRRLVAGVALVATVVGLVGFIAEPLERQWRNYKRQRDYHFIPNSGASVAGFNGVPEILRSFPYAAVWMPPGSV